MREGRDETTGYEVRGYLEEGGTVTRGSARDGDVVAASESAIQGSVSDSVGMPAAGVRVVVEGSVAEAVTDERGGFGFGLRRPRSVLHLTNPEIVALALDMLAAVLATAPSIEVRRHVTGRTRIRLHPTAEGARTSPDAGCEPDLYLNDSRVLPRIDGNWKAPAAPDARVPLRDRRRGP